MSRCFPYPPPGHSLKRTTSEGLIESIKLQKEREKAKAERKKEKNREKRERERGKKEKAKLNPNGSNHDKKAYNEGKRCLDFEESYLQKRREVDTEQLERSGLTEEHELPVWSQNSSYSSDNSHNSNKRKRDASPSRGRRACGNIIRIQLPPQKRKELNLSCNKEIYSISGRQELFANKQLCLSHGKQGIPMTTGKRDEPEHKVVTRATQADLCSNSPGTGHVVERLPRRRDNTPCSTSGRAESPGQYDKGIASGTPPIEKEMQSWESLYKDLLKKLTPQVIHSVLPDFDNDQEWLFGGKHQDRQIEKKVKSCGDISCCGPTTHWPSAQYLPEADLYALPYMVPY